MHRRVDQPLGRGVVGGQRQQAQARQRAVGRAVYAFRVAKQRAQGLQAHDAESVARGAKLCERSVAAQRREKRHALGIAECTKGQDMQAWI